MMAERVGFELSLNPRKLLIFRGATIARTSTPARVGYSFGTLSPSRHIFEVAA